MGYLEFPLEVHAVLSQTSRVSQNDNCLYQICIIMEVTLIESMTNPKYFRHSIFMEISCKY